MSVYRENKNTSTVEQKSRAKNKNRGSVEAVVANYSNSVMEEGSAHFKGQNLRSTFRKELQSLPVSDE